MVDDEKPEFEQEEKKEEGKEKKEEAQQGEEICGKPHRSGSFVRNWGGWTKAGG